MKITTDIDIYEERHNHICFWQ